MAKTIKFNLRCDGQLVRDLDDLRENFNIEDILEYYNNQTLHRWLKSRGYLEELDKVSAIKDMDLENITKKLVMIFEIDINEEEIKEAIKTLDYMRNRLELRSMNKEIYTLQSQISEEREELRKVQSQVSKEREKFKKLQSQILKKGSQIEQNQTYKSYQKVNNLVEVMEMWEKAGIFNIK